MNASFITIKDATFKKDLIAAFGKYFIPATMQTPEYFAISFWLLYVKEPIIITYASADERDQAYDELLKSMSQ